MELIWLFKIRWFKWVLYISIRLLKLSVYLYVKIIYYFNKQQEMTKIKNCSSPFVFYKNVKGLVWCSQIEHLDEDCSDAIRKLRRIEDIRERNKQITIEILSSKNN